MAFPLCAPLEQGQSACCIAPFLWHMLMPQTGVGIPPFWDYPPALRQLYSLSRGSLEALLERWPELVHDFEGMLQVG